MFKKAERKQAKLKLAIMGTSNGGKTMSALRLAKGIGGRIALIDTESGSASLYADKFDFDTVDLAPPFTANKYVEAINAAESAGYDIIIVDSFSHAWAGEGGALDQKAMLDARSPKGQFGNWKQPKQEYAKVKNAILHSSCHVLCTIRAKQAYLQADGENGKTRIKKMALDPIAEPGVEYEFTTVFEVDSEDHHAKIAKDRTGLFDQSYFLITEETGKKLADWLLSAKPGEVPSSVVPAPSPIDGVMCIDCGTQLILHANKRGYICPKWTKDSSHFAIRVEDLDAYKREQAQPTVPHEGDWESFGT